MYLLFSSLLRAYGFTGLTTATIIEECRNYKFKFKLVSNSLSLVYNILYRFCTFMHECPTVAWQLEHPCIIE